MQYSFAFDDKMSESLVDFFPTLNVWWRKTLPASSDPCGLKRRVRTTVSAELGLGNA